MTKVFLAYASGNDFHDSILKDSAKSASTINRQVTPWSEKDTSGQQISKSVESWIEDSDAFVGDISVVNVNVTYEIGYAIGLGKPVRLIHSTHLNFETVKDVGLLDTLGNDSYDFEPRLRSILKKPDQTPNWNISSRNRDQPIFILFPPETTDVSRATISAVKKVARLRFKHFNPVEISRLNATEAYEQAASSFGIIAFWLEGEDENVVRNNQRAAFIFGVARGLDIPALLIAHESTRLPIDLHDYASRWGRMDDLDGLIEKFRNDVADELVQFIDDRSSKKSGVLSNLNFGDPIAENEQSQLENFFLETDSFNQALDGNAHVLVGRKGSGKSAAFFQVRDRTRSNKQNIVVDLMPEGYQLIKLKEFILDKLAFGTRKEVIAAFWEYIMWLEIAYKILEKDGLRAKYDSDVLRRYQQLERLYNLRVDTGQGDFSERLGILSENVASRFQSQAGDNAGTLKSSEVLEIIYGQDIRELREAVLSYLKLKGFVQFLFDNLDRIWTPGGFGEDDAIIIVGLVEAMQEISRKFQKQNYDFRWTLFVRSDVYEFLVAGMADYGKLSTHSLEWSDRGQMKALFNLRMVATGDHGPEHVEIERISDTVVSGQPVMDFLIDGSMMRPRYLIRLFETARRRALALKNERIREDDYVFALNELGWQALEDIDREIVDLVPDGKNLIFDLLDHADKLTPDLLRYVAGKRMSNKDDVEKLLEVMVWNGSIGVRTESGDKYIFNTGYKRQYISTLIKGNGSAHLLIHPTLRAAIASG